MRRLAKNVCSVFGVNELCVKTNFRDTLDPNGASGLFVCLAKTKRLPENPLLHVAWAGYKSTCVLNHTNKLILGCRLCHRSVLVQVVVQVLLFTVP